MITRDALQELLNREPFEPFRLRLTSGDAYEVRDPNSVALGMLRFFIAFPDSDKSVLSSYQHVAAVESVGNGRRARPRKRPRS